jgi:hypothetical protein
MMGCDDVDKVALGDECRECSAFFSEDFVEVSSQDNRFSSLLA